MVQFAVAPFIDGYPCDPALPEFAVQNILDRDLRNCLALQGRTAIPNTLYPSCCAANGRQRQTWLAAALRRFEFNLGREPWVRYFPGLIRLLCPSSFDRTPLGDDTLLMLARLGPHLQRNGGSGDCEVNELIARSLELHPEPLSSELTTALQKLVLHLVSVHCHEDSTFRIAWRLWRAQGYATTIDSCFSSRVRRDLEKMCESEAAAWSAFWDLRGSNQPTHDEVTPHHLKQLRKAVERIGLNVFLERLTTWFGYIQLDHKAALSAAGRDVLIHLLHACRAVPEMPTDEPLYGLCGVRWAATGNALFTKEWLGALLVTLATRPPNTAFACAENLANNPDTSGFEEVIDLYDQLLEEVIGAPVPMQARDGVDGYDLGTEPTLFQHQTILDRRLKSASPRKRRRPVDRAWSSGEMLTEVVARQAAEDPAGFLRAIANRLRWLAETRKPPVVLERGAGVIGYEIQEVDKHQLWSYALLELEHRLLAAKPQLSVFDMVALIEADSGGTPGYVSSGLLKLVASHIRKHGYSAPLVRAMANWRRSMHGSAHAVSIRHKIGWLLWFENVAPVQQLRCWSDRIRLDLRAMDPAQHRIWRDVFELTSFGAAGKPSKKWLAAAGAVLKRLGQQNFRSQIQAWFQPFRSGQQLQMTVVGRDILRTLLWFCLASPDPQLEEAAEWFALAQWKTKKDKACASLLWPAYLQILIESSPERAYRVAEVYLARGSDHFTGKTFEIYEDLCAQLGHPLSMDPPPQPQSASRDQMMRTMLQRTLNKSKAKLEGDYLIVTGVCDSYSIDMKEFGIIRRSDGRRVRLELDWSRPPLAQFRSMMDGADLGDPFQPNYFRLLLSADVLARDDENAAQIIAEDS